MSEKYSDLSPSYQDFEDEWQKLLGEKMMQEEALRRLVVALHPLQDKNLPNWAKFRLRDLISSILRVLNPYGVEEINDEIIPPPPAMLAPLTQDETNV